MSSESLYKQGVSFLQNASSQGLSISEQVRVLEEKGLSPADIRAALHSVSSATSSSPFPSPSRREGWLWSVLVPVIVIGAGCTAYVLSKALEEDDYEDRLNFNSDDEEGCESDGAEKYGQAHIFDERDLTDGSIQSDSMESRSNPNIDKLVTVIEKQTSAIQQAVELFTSKMASQSTKSSVEDSLLPAEKAYMDAESMSQDTIVENVKDAISRIVNTYRNDDECDGSISFSQVRKGFSSIIMYIQKIIDNPLISRYHRLSTANSTFKASVSSISDHEVLLEALGFSKKGSFWEWQMQRKVDISENKNSRSSKTTYLETLPKCVELLESCLSNIDEKSNLQETLKADDMKDEGTPVQQDIYSKDAMGETLRYDEIFDATNNA